MTSPQIIQKFQNIISNYYKVEKGSPIIAAVSGGADSMVLFHLLVESKIKFIVAHCNFSLRGKESDADEQFVKSTCKEFGIKFLLKRFDTKAYAQSKKISIEMAARDLRYDWFSELSYKNNSAFVATGHHGDDAIETFFLNLSRGTGLKGLTGIPAKRGFIIRPLLFLSSDDVINYCKDKEISYRTDSTNLEVNFNRNKIRHHIIPLFKEINPSFFRTMQNNMTYLHEAWEVFNTESKRVKEEITAGIDDSLLIPISLINEHPQKRLILFDILQPYGFNSNELNNIIDGLTGISGKQFFSKTYRLIIDRYNLILLPRSEKDDQEYHINADETNISEPIKLKIRSFDISEDFKFSSDPNVVHLDADQLDFPLYIRKAEPGDRFQPLGMENFKKISDFFIDSKLSLIEKDNTWLLTNGNDIIWVIGRRIDNRFKIRTRTKKVLEIMLL